LFGGVVETFYANSTEITVGKELEITDASEILHAAVSLRIRQGEMVEIIDGKGSRFRSEVLHCSKISFKVMPLEIIKCDSEYEDVRLTVAVSMLNKNSKMKLLIEKLTELGISEFIPFVSERTSFPKMKPDSLKASMISALKQCGGSRDVSISEVLTFDELTGLKGFDEKYFADFDGAYIRKDVPKGKLLAVIGPEGGLTGLETETLKKNGFKPVRLNKRILRAETAAIVTASKFLN
jgi:16S rRNA (uracil1498-N3)-methyltransferase